MVVMGGSAQAALPAECGVLRTHYGPFDYRTDRSKLGVVEQYHFTPKVEALVRGVSGSVESELSYTLHAFPNHHRALVSLSRLQQMRKNDKPGQLPYTVGCFFERAVAFRPDDHVVRMLYATYLGKLGRVPDAEQQLGAIKDEQKNNPLTVYNMGLVALELGKPDLALGYAHQAMALGATRQELKNALQAAGHWKDPAPGTAPAGGAASAPAAAGSAASN